MTELSQRLMALNCNLFIPFGPPPWSWPFSKLVDGLYTRFCSPFMLNCNNFGDLWLFLECHHLVKICICLTLWFMTKYLKMTFPSASAIPCVYQQTKAWRHAKLRSQVSARVACFHHHWLVLEPINACDYCRVIWRMNECHLYTFPLTTKARC